MRVFEFQKHDKAMTEKPKQSEVKESDAIYDEYACLKPLREYLGELSRSDILGEGTMGVVVRSRKDNLAVKALFSEGEKQKEEIRTEFKFHDECRTALLDGYLEGRIDPVIKVPRINFVEGVGITMDMIDGQSLLTHHLRSIFFDRTPKTQDELSKMTDYEVERHLMLECGVDEDDILDARIIPKMELMQRYFPHLVKPLNDALSYLSEKGVEHPDLHSGNLMLSESGDCYIIDLGLQSE